MPDTRRTQPPNNHSRAEAASPLPTRRHFLAAAGGFLLLGAAGCGSGNSGDSGGSGGGTGGSGGGSGDSRTIEHQYGSTEITGEPERVVTVGTTDQDPVLALGVMPVGIKEWYGDYEYAVWPWAQDELGGAQPEVLPATELNFEQIAALEPDLILGISAAMTSEEYDTLSGIAPTIPQSGEYADFGVPWQEQTRVIGRALGSEQQAGDLVSEVESQFEQARSENPDFEGANGLVVGVNEQGDSYSPAPYTTEDVRGRFMSSLGFELPEEIAELAGDSFFIDLSRERLDLLDAADVLVWVEIAIGFGPVREDPLYQELDVAQENRDIFLEDEVLNGALSFGSVLSLPFALENLVPRLATAIEGGSSTTTTRETTEST
ncbi:iron-siderophore ABC transporter substrate-binding protein [Rubrobacter aplysinae]|uniref:iron-siderophore ABC transporter substrate-binding protein n=1 Tax=Rubrobacter aplysinae TaxID=909625 RepID=UPI0009FEF23B|nr:iron-siderophore ABC transporter substrate-binding protein [Rubrobacter aplysinae]